MLGRDSWGQGFLGTSTGTGVQPRGDVAGGAAEGDTWQGQSIPEDARSPRREASLFAENKDFLRLYEETH